MKPMFSALNFLGLATVAVFLSACGSTPPQPGYYAGATPWSLEDQGDFVATTSALNQYAQATFQSGAATATAMAAYATGQTQAAASATAGQLANEQRATAGASTATAESLQVTQTAAAMHGQATATAIANSGTATAVANLGNFDAQRLAAESQRLNLENLREAAEVERARHWAAFTEFLPFIVVVLLAIAGLAAFSYFRTRARPIVVTANGHQEVLVPPRYYARLTPVRPGQLPELPAVAQSTNQPIELPPMTHGHVLIAGETGSGKTTALRAILRRRPNVTVLDPHAAPAAWGGQTRVIGGGRNFEAIAAFMVQMRQLLSQRYNQRAQGMTQFEPLTIATDEMPAIVTAVGPEIATLWREWVREGRKVGLYFVVSTQSTRVKTLGIEGEGDLLENFDVLLLGKVAALAFPDLVVGMERPAVLRTLHNARPVIIPPVANEPIPPPIINMPSSSRPVEEEDPEAARIRQLAAEGLSRRSIEQAVFGYAGGEAYETVKRVLEAATSRGNGRFSAAT